MPLNVARIRQCLQNFDFRALFVQELGWDKHPAGLTVAVDGATYKLQPIAQKRGFQVFECPSSEKGCVPDHPTRSKIERQVAKSAHEHIIIYTDAAKTIQKWQWVRRELGRPLARREYDFFKGHTGELLAQKLQYLAVELDEEERLSLVDVTRRVKQAFDVDRVTKRFYDRFKTEHATFLKFIKGITASGDSEWYASLMLNRLMFVYFIQKKGFLDGDPDYLRNRMNTVRQQKGKDKFHSFYRYFLLRLFHEGLGQPPAQRKKDLEALLGDVPYLNGGLFDVHELERSYPDIQIADDAFEKLFDFFDAYQWHLDERPLRADNEINPDVLGYIFEKYINQKQMGAYYTKEDITGYIARNTIIPFLFNAAEKKCAIAFRVPPSPSGRGDGGEELPALWRLLRDDPDRYIYPAVKHGVIRTLPSPSGRGAGGEGEIVPESELPDFVQTGMHDPKARMFDKRYNLQQAPAGDPIRLVTETWREYVYRRNRCLEIRDKLRRGEVHDINDLITLNLDICQFAEDVIANCEGPELLRAFWHAIKNVSVLDPTCGSGAFLFAALNILEPLYEACLERMRAFLEDLQRAALPSPSGRGAGGEGSKPPHPPLPPDLLEFARKLRREQTDAEKLMWCLLRDRRLAGCKFRRQHPIEPYVLDFFSHELQLAIELDGGQHKTEEGQRHDERRTKFLAQKGIHILRFWNHDVLQDTDTVLQAIWDKIEELTPSPPTPLPKGEGSKKPSPSGTGLGAGPISPSPSGRQAGGEGKKPHPDKFSDFRKILEDVAQHPNHRYFILKSIIIGNLYGVDIMEEAVEICKLRLFLKLVAQVENARQVEPLPDIDFNIRPGNTLVGYASLDEVKKTLQGNLGFGKKEVDRIIEEAEIVDRAFTKFRQMQTEHSMDAKEFSTAKTELRRRLDKLRNELDRFLAGEYGVDIPSPNPLPVGEGLMLPSPSGRGAGGEGSKYQRWRKSHQPFHWFVEFYGIMAGGGFDVIIGNPPWIECAKVKNDYTIKNYQTESCGNLHAVCTERGLRIRSPLGCMSFIVQLPMVSSSRMVAVRRVLRQSSTVLHVIPFGDRPGKLFDGLEHSRATIWLSSRYKKVNGENARFATSRYNRWPTEVRPFLFHTLEYAPTNGVGHIPLYPDQFPKYANRLAVLVFQRMRDCGDHTISELLSQRETRAFVFYQEATEYWVKATVGLPYYAKNGKVGAPAHGRYLYLASEDAARWTCALMHSSLFFVYFVAHSDCFHLSDGLVRGFPVPKSLIGDKKLMELGSGLMDALRRGAERKTIQTKASDKIAYDEYYGWKAKPNIDRIDALLAKHYGFTDEELDFIINYDIKYRMGQDGADDGGDEGDSA